MKNKFSFLYLLSVSHFQCLSDLILIRLVGYGHEIIIGLRRTTIELADEPVLDRSTVILKLQIIAGMEPTFLLYNKKIFVKNCKLDTETG